MQAFDFETGLPKQCVKMVLYICYARTELALTLIMSKLLYHVQAFDFKTGLLKGCVKMESYICYARTELALTLITSELLYHVQAFDFETGLPKRCVKMVSWPLMDRLSRPFWDHLARAALESFVPTKTTEGFLVMFDRSDSPSPCEIIVVIIMIIVVVIIIVTIVRGFSCHV